MLRPVSDIQSTAHELSHLCQLFGQLQLDCDDSNLSWKIAQLLSTAEELNEQFMDEYRLWAVSEEGEVFYDKSILNDRVEAGLSAAFQSAAILDSSVYKEFAPSKEFLDAVKFLRNQSLNLLHERRRWKE